MRRNMTLSIDEDLATEFRLKVIRQYGTSRHLSTVVEMLMKAYVEMDGDSKP